MDGVPEEKLRDDFPSIEPGSWDMPLTPIDALITDVDTLCDIALHDAMLLIDSGPVEGDVLALLESFETTTVAELLSGIRKMPAYSSFVVYTASEVDGQLDVVLRTSESERLGVTPS